jgi:hypothetical protein
MKAPFIGAYNPETDLGVARLIEPGAVAGNKLFAFGLPFLDRSYTDGDSQYFEIWGGANNGFWPEDDIDLAPGDTLQWQESWWPLPELGGITWANRNAALHVEQSDNTGRLSLMVPHPQQGRLTLLAGERQILSEPFAASPAKPRRWDFSAPTEPIWIKLTDDSGEPLLDYCAGC